MITISEVEVSIGVTLDQPTRGLTVTSGYRVLAGSAAVRWQTGAGLWPLGRTHVAILGAAT